MLSQAARSSPSLIPGADERPSVGSGEMSDALRFEVVEKAPGHGAPRGLLEAIPEYLEVLALGVGEVRR